MTYLKTFQQIAVCIFIQHLFCNIFFLKAFFKLKYCNILVVHLIVLLLVINYPRKINFKKEQGSLILYESQNKAVFAMESYNCTMSLIES